MCYERLDTMAVTNSCVGIRILFAFRVVIFHSASLERGREGKLTYVFNIKKERRKDGTKKW